MNHIKKKMEDRDILIAMMEEHPELFYDISHLNTVGADMFTKELVSMIK